AGLTVGVVTSDAPIQVVAEPDARVAFPTFKPLLGEGNRECGRGFFGFPPDQPMVRRRIARAASGGGWPAAAGDGRHLINRRGARAAPTGVGAARTRRGLESRSEEHTSELQSRENLVCRLLLEKKKTDNVEPRTAE